MNDGNLIPNSQRTPEELREQTRKAGIASGKARRLKKHGRELLLEMLAMKELDPSVVNNLAAAWGLDPKAVTKEIAMNARQVDKAIRKADTFAYKTIHQVAGTLEKNETTNNTFNVTISAEAAKAGSKWSEKG